MKEGRKAGKKQGRKEGAYINMKSL